MPNLTLYHFPGACSQVPLCALEMAGLPYSLELINLAANGQSSADYLARSPLGKVPLLEIDGSGLSENAAILTYIGALAPDAAIFGSDRSARGQAEAVGGVAFCGGTLHPIVRGLANPARLSMGDVEGVRAQARYLGAKAFGYAEKRLAESGWWLGEVSVVDVYLDWAFSVARRNALDTSLYPRLDSLAVRLRESLPAFGRMEAGNATARVALGLPQ